MTWTRATLLAAAVVVTAAIAAHAHPAARTTTRELVRVQGYRSASTPDGVVRRVVLVALGTEHAFAATDWQTFGFAEPAPEPTPAAEKTARFILQGTREELARFAAARPEQQVTLLAEHRQGSVDLFVLALDLCPSQ